MQITTATPAEIDTEIARLADKAGALFAMADQAEAQIVRIEAKGDGSSEVRETAIAVLRESAHEARTRGNAAMIEARPFVKEYLFSDRGRWSRFYLVVSSDGHVHSSTACPSCYVTTGYAWLTEYSGTDVHEFVEQIAGEKACTTCFPWAPVNVLRQKTKLEAPARRAARLTREKKAAEKAAIAAVKGITNPDGTELVIPEGYQGRILKTEIAASRAASEAAWNIQWYNVALADEACGDHPSTPEWNTTVDLCLAALAHKRGTTVEDERTALTTKIAKKVAKDLNERRVYQAKFNN
jgi:hypothetical protein